MSFCCFGFIREDGAPVEWASPRKKQGVVRWNLNNFLAAQAELKALMINSVLLKTCAQPLPCKFRLDMAQVADCVFFAEVASSCEHIYETSEILCHYRLHREGASKRNMKSLQSWVLDEWKAMQIITGLMRESSIQRWLRHQKLRFLFAARSHVKIKLTHDTAPELALEIAKVSKNIVGNSFWILGKTAMILRDLLVF